MAVATLFTDELQRRAKPKMMGGDGTHELYAAHICAVEHRTAGNTEDASCAICMEAMNVESGDVWVLPCRHAFHRTCIGTFLRQRAKRERRCVLCRIDLSNDPALTAWFEVEPCAPAEKGFEVRSQQQQPEQQQVFNIFLNWGPPTPFVQRTRPSVLSRLRGGWRLIAGGQCWSLRAHDASAGAEAPA